MTSWTPEATDALFTGNFSFEFVKTNEDLFVFVSSTFSDTHLERNEIQSTIAPELRKNANKLGIQLIFLDMRY